LTALLFGGMTLYSFGFAAILFTALPAPSAGATLRRAFPWFYVFVVVTAGLAARRIGIGHFEPPRCERLGADTTCLRAAGEI